MALPTFPAPVDALRRRHLLALAMGGPVGWPAARASAPVIRHSLRPMADGRLSYREEVLRLLLEKARPRFGDCELQFTGLVPQARAFSELENGRLDLCAAMTDVDRERRAVPVRYCLYRGLLGLRVGLGLPETVKRLDSVDSLEALRAVRFGLVQDWPDYAIQRAAGLQVVRLATVSSGVARLRLGGFDLLPVGAVEADDVALEFELAKVWRWGLIYPTAFYFFVSPQQPQLAERLKHGFEVALHDGSFDALFGRFVEPTLHAMRVSQRQLFKFPNPLLPSATPLGRAELWHPLLGRLQPSV